MKRILFAPQSKLIFHRKFTSLNKSTASPLKEIRGGGGHGAHGHGATDPHHHAVSQNPNDVYIDDVSEILLPITNSK